MAPNKIRRRNNRRAGNAANPNRRAQAPPAPPGLLRRNRRTQTRRGPLDIFNPLNSLPVPVVQHEGTALPVRGLIERAVNSPSSEHVVMFVTNTGRSATILATVSTAAPTRFADTVPLLAGSATGGGPTSARAMKAGVTIINRTPRLNQGGLVTIVPVNQRMLFPAAPSVMTSGQWVDVVEDLKSMPESRSYDGTHFANGKTIFCHPVATTPYLEYQNWLGTDSFDGILSSIGVWTGSSENARPMSTVAIIFDTAGAVNNYQVRARGHWYTRWPTGTILGQHMKPVQSAPQAVVNSLHAVAQSTSSVLREGTEDVGLAGIGAAAALGAQRGASFLAAAMRTAAPVAAEMEAYAPLLGAFAV